MKGLRPSAPIMIVILMSLQIGVADEQTGIPRHAPGDYSWRVTGVHVSEDLATGNAMNGTEVGEPGEGHCFLSFTAEAEIRLAEHALLPVPTPVVSLPRLMPRAFCLVNVARDSHERYVAVAVSEQRLDLDGYGKYICTIAFLVPKDLQLKDTHQLWVMRSIVPVLSLERRLISAPAAPRVAPGDYPWELGLIFVRRSQELLARNPFHWPPFTVRTAPVGHCFLYFTADVHVDVPEYQKKLGVLPGLIPSAFCITNRGKDSAEFYAGVAASETPSRPYWVLEEFSQETRTGRLAASQYITFQTSGKHTCSIAFLVPEDFELTPSHDIWVMRSIRLPDGLSMGTEGQDN